MEGIREPQIEVPNHGRAAGRAPGTRKVPRKYAGLAPNSLSGVPDCQVRKAPVVTPNRLEDQFTALDSLITESPVKSHTSSARSTFASTKSAVSNPSVNHS